jgi:hypothetical protein
MTALTPYHHALRLKAAVLQPERPAASVTPQTGERHQGAESARQRRPSDLIRFAPA